VIAEDDHDALVRCVRGLRAGRWWPELPELLADIDRHVPDTFVVGTDQPSLIV
jgi:hypothetical protein